MFSILDIQIPPPEIWQHFQTLCWDLFGTLYGIPDTQLFGRSGQSQQGVDIIHFKNQEYGWIGIQCKEKTQYPLQALTDTQVNAAVIAAKKFEPKLSRFIIATTARRDSKIQQFVAKITEEHSKSGLFSVQVYSWDDIQDLLEKYPEVLKRYYPNYQKLLMQSMVEVQQSTTTEQHEFDETPQTRTTIIEEKSIVYAGGFIQETLSSEYNAELDGIKKLLDSNDPTTASHLLQLLKKRVWINASNEIKYRIMTNEGAIKFQLGKYPESGKSFIEALQYNPDDEKALGNVAFGYLLNQNYEKAIEFASKVLQKNPLSTRAYSVIILSKAHDESIEVILLTIPQEVIRTQDVAGAIGTCYYNSGDFTEASKWLEIAVNNVEEDNINLKGLFASSLHNKVKKDDNTLNGLQISDKIFQLLVKSIELFDYALDKISQNPALQKLHVLWLLERGISKRMIGRSQESSIDINNAHRLDPNNPIIIFFHGLAELDSGHYFSAEDLLKPIIWNSATPGALWNYLSSLEKQGKFDEGISLIKDLLLEKRPKDQEDTLSHFLIAFKLLKGKAYFNDAESIAFTRFKEDETDIVRVVELVSVLRFIGKTDKNEELIQKIKDLYSESLLPLQQLEIANLFMALNHFDDSASIYEKIIDPTQNTPLTQKFIDTQYFGGHHKRALELCRSLHAIHGPLPHSSFIELAIYQEIGDLVEAKKLCIQYLDRFPEDFEMKLNQAIVNIRSQNTSEVLDFIKAPIKYDNLTYTSGKKLVQLDYSLGRFDEAIELAYKLRQKYFDLPVAHLDYFRLILDIEERSSLLNKPSVVGIGSIVRLEDKFGDLKTYYISDHDPSPQGIDELHINNGLGKLLSGKIEGDLIVLQKTSIGEEVAHIKNIINKFVYAFQDSVNNFNQRFPGHPGIYRIPFGSGSSGEIIQEDIQNLKKIANQNNKRVELLIDFYKKRQLTIAGIAKELGIDDFAVCSALTRNSNVGIFYFSGNPSEREEGLNLLNAKIKLIIDSIALFTVYSLNLGNFLFKKYGKLGITQSTIDLIQYAIQDCSGQKARGYLTLIQNGDNLSYLPTSPEEIQKTKANLEQMLEWVQLNCDIIPCYPALELNYTKKEEYSRLLGAASIDTILIASQPDTILYSDDALLRGIAKQLYQSKSVWTQLVITDLYTEKIILKEQMEEFTLKLILSRYFHTSINATILLKAAKLSGCEIKHPFSEVLSTLKEGYSDLQSSIRVALDFTVLLWKEQIRPESRKKLLITLLDVITDKRDKTAILIIFYRLITDNPQLTTVEKNEILDLI